MGLSYHGTQTRRCSRNGPLAYQIGVGARAGGYRKMRGAGKPGKRHNAAWPQPNHPASGRCGQSDSAGGIDDCGIDDCCVWRRGTLKSSIVNVSIVNWPATPKVAHTRNLRGTQRNGASVVHCPAHDNLSQPSSGRLDQFVYRDAIDRRPAMAVALEIDPLAVGRKDRRHTGGVAGAMLAQRQLPAGGAQQ
jgi:hypothetical protein